MIARVILPVISQHDIYGQGMQQTGLSDALPSAFFSPVGGGLVCGTSTALLIPTATDNLLGTNLVLAQQR